MPMLHQQVVDQEIRTWAALRLTSPLYLKTLTPPQPLINTTAIQNNIDRLNKKVAQQYASIGEVGNEALLLKLIKQNEADIARLEKELQVKPKPMEFEPTKLRKRFLNFGKLSLEEQKDRLHTTFNTIRVDDEGSIIGVELRK